MAHISPTPPSRWSNRALAILALTFFALAALVGAAFVVLVAVAHVQVSPPDATPEQAVARSTLGIRLTETSTTTAVPGAAIISPNPTDHSTTSTTSPSATSTAREPEIEYTTERGKGSNEGTVDSMLGISVRVPEPDGRPETAPPVSVGVQLLDEQGRPAQYGGHPADPFAMLPSFGTNAWSYYGSIPGLAGTYHARVVIAVHGNGSPGGPTPGQQSDQPLVFDLTGSTLKALAESGPPLASGYVFSRDSNLWLMSTDTKRQRRLTFFTPPDEYAYGPAWSPDGKKIAFAFSPKTDQSQIPSTDIWSVGPGMDARQLVQHAENEELRDPAWSSDGRYLYFTAEQSDPSQTVYNSLGVPQSGMEIDRLDTKTGARSQWLVGGEMPGSGASPRTMLYVEDVFYASSDPSQPGNNGQQLMSINADGSHKVVLVDKDQYLAIAYPAISPDGKWVAFAAINMPPLGERNDFDLLSWLGLKPQVASAHGLPWDLFIVPATGGKPIKLSKLSDDQPHPAWLTNTKLTYMGSYSMYDVQIDANGKPLDGPHEIHTGVPHGGLTWHGP